MAEKYISCWPQPPDFLFEDASHLSSELGLAYDKFSGDWVRIPDVQVAIISAECGGFSPLLTKKRKQFAEITAAGEGKSGTTLVLTVKGLEQRQVPTVIVEEHDLFKIARRIGGSRQRSSELGTRSSGANLSF